MQMVRRGEIFIGDLVLLWIYQGLNGVFVRSLIVVVFVRNSEG